MTIALRRIASSDKGTFGVLVRGGLPLCLTCEDPWNDNQPNVSCIPAGVYKTEPWGWENNSPARHKRCWLLRDVPNREAILIHTGNNINNTEGCILVGANFGVYQKLPSVLRSGDTMEYLRGLLPSKFTLEITNCF